VQRQQQSTKIWPAMNSQAQATGVAAVPVRLINGASGASYLLIARRRALAALSRA
jgi:hypothetical protein